MSPRPTRRLTHALALALTLTGAMTLACTKTQTQQMTRADAERIALTQTPGGTVKEAELETEHGKLVWSFDIAKPGSRDIVEVQVDATTGRVVSVEIETPADQEAEKKRDEAEKARK